MSQSSVIAFALFVAFIVFVTMRGELPLYMGIIMGEGAPSGGSAGGSGGGGGALGSLGGGSSGGGVSVGTVAELAAFA